MREPRSSNNTFPLSREAVYAGDFLDHLRDALHRWSTALFDSESGGSRHNDSIGVSIMSSTDMVWIRYATNDPDPGAPDREKRIAYLENAQDPRTGQVYHDRGPAGQSHCDAHAFWQTVRALNILGGRLRHFPHHLSLLMTPQGLEAWFDGIDWDSRQHSNHHEVLGIVPLLASLDSPEWTATFYRKLAEQQDAVSGGWPRGSVNVSRTFAYTVMHVAVDRLPAYPEKIIDTMLALQGTSGFWDMGHPDFRTMDAAYILVRLPALTRHREEDAGQSLQRVATAVRDTFARRQEHYTDNPHKMLAITHTFGLLQEAFPQAFRSNPTYRFDWDNPQVYRCEVIRERAGG